MATYGGASRSNQGAGNSDSQVVSFTLGDAERIAKVVGEVEGSRRGTSGSYLPRAASGSASHFLSQTTNPWTKGTSQTLTLWAGDPGSEAALSDQTVTAWNYVASLPSGLRVVIAKTNGSFYLASFDFTGLSGYSASSQQILAHNTSGQLVWLNTTACP